MDSSDILSVFVIPLIVYLSTSSERGWRVIIAPPDDGMGRKGSWIPGQGDTTSTVRVPYWCYGKARRRRASSTSPSSDTRRIAGLRRVIGRRSRRRITTTTITGIGRTRRRTYCSWSRSDCIVIAIGLAVIVMIRIIRGYTVLVVGIVDNGHYGSMFKEVIIRRKAIHI
jgi:hypothetical protein